MEALKLPVVANGIFSDKPQGEKIADGLFWTGREGQMGVWYFNPESEVRHPPHVHAEYVFVTCLAGEIRKHQAGRTEAIEPGEAWVGNHGQEYGSAYLSRYGRLAQAVVVSLDRRLLAAWAKDFHWPWDGDSACPLFTGKARGDWLPVAQAIAAELQGRRAGHKLLVEALAMRLVVEVLRVWPRMNLSRGTVDVCPRLPWREFIRAYEFMRRCRKEHFRLQHLCRFVGSSEERFTRLFLASTRRTPASFYNRLLLERARELLGNPKFSIKEIGFELGFKTSSHFIAAFRREFAVSPQEYRQQSAGGGACYTSVKTVAEISRPPRKDAGKTIPRFLEPVAWPPSEWRP